DVLAARPAVGVLSQQLNLVLSDGDAFPVRPQDDERAVLLRRGVVALGGVALGNEGQDENALVRNGERRTSPDDLAVQFPAGVTTPHDEEADDRGNNQPTNCAHRKALKFQKCGREARWAKGPSVMAPITARLDLQSTFGNGWPSFRLLR